MVLLSYPVGLLDTNSRGQTDKLQPFQRLSISGLILKMLNSLIITKSNARHIHHCFQKTVRDITWQDAIKCALHQVEVGTCTSDTWSLD